MTFVTSAMCLYMMYFIVAPAARRRPSSDYCTSYLALEQDSKSPVLLGKYIYTLRLY
jgi:hypothetical protein